MSALNLSRLCLIIMLFCDICLGYSQNVESVTSQSLKIVIKNSENGTVYIVGGKVIPYNQILHELTTLKIESKSFEPMIIAFDTDITMTKIMNVIGIAGKVGWTTQLYYFVDKSTLVQLKFGNRESNLFPDQDLFRKKVGSN